MTEVSNFIINLHEPQVYRAGIGSPFNEKEEKLGLQRRDRETSEERTGRVNRNM